MPEQTVDLVETFQTIVEVASTATLPKPYKQDLARRCQALGTWVTNAVELEEKYRSLMAAAVVILATFDPTSATGEQREALLDLEDLVDEPEPSDND